MCEEQCQSVLRGLGYEGRPERSVQLGGLVLHGRARPGTVVRGSDDYDAAQIFMEDRVRPLSERRLAAILMDATALMQNPFFSGNLYEDLALIEQELERRGAASVEFLSYALVEAGASRIISLLLLDRLNTLGSLGETALQLPEGSATVNLDEWKDCLAHIAPKNTIDVHGLEKENPADQLMRSLAVTLAHDDVCRAALGPAFRNRVMNWLARLHRADLRGFVETPAPTVPLFLAESQEWSIPEDARWIIDRFTKTDLGSWDDKSLMLEWGAVQGNPPPLNGRVWRERVLSAEELSVAFMQRSQVMARPSRRQGLEASEYVGVARDKLLAEEYGAACEIFEGLSVLRGADGEVHNNWAFCMLPHDPQRALEILENSILFPMDDRNLRTANRAFFLHMLGRNEEAMLVLKRVSDVDAGNDILAWVHETCDAQLTLRANWTSLDYVKWLSSHLGSDLPS